MQKKKLKGVSVQSIIIGSVVVAVISIAGLAAMWDSVEKSKVYVLAETMDEQDAYIISQREYDYKKIFDAHASGDGDNDYLDDLIKKGQLSPLPMKLFKDPDTVTWELRSYIKPNGTLGFYYIYDAENPDDIKLITDAISHRGYL